MLRQHVAWARADAVELADGLLGTMLPAAQADPSPEVAMSVTSADKPETVDRTGAPAGSVLRGAVRTNQGLRLCVLQGQTRGDWGPLAGDFVILDTGDNRHTPALAELLHRPTDAATTLAVLRRASPGCVKVVKKNILVAEPHEGSGTALATSSRGTGEPARRQAGEDY
jgi:hypothetical protein